MGRGAEGRRGSGRKECRGGGGRTLRTSEKLASFSGRGRKEEHATPSSASGAPSALMRVSYAGYVLGWRDGTTERPAYKQESCSGRKRPRDMPGCGAVPHTNRNVRLTFEAGHCIHLYRPSHRPQHVTVQQNTSFLYGTTIQLCLGARIGAGDMRPEANYEPVEIASGGPATCRPCRTPTPSAFRHVLPPQHPLPGRADALPHERTDGGPDGARRGYVSPRVAAGVHVLGSDTVYAADSVPGCYTTGVEEREDLLVHG